jgi:hypothetical protein
MCCKLPSWRIVQLLASRPSFATVCWANLVLLSCRIAASGTYDWAGALNLDPDPFEAWGFHVSGTRRLLEVWGEPAVNAPLQSHTVLDALLPRTRSLLQAGSSSLPVHGRVSVREARSAGDAANGAPPPGSEGVIDDEISSFNPIPPDPSNPAGYTWLEEHPAGPPPEPQLPQAVQDVFASVVRAFSDPNNQRTMIIVAALVVPLGLALCVAGFAAACLRRKKQREQKQASTSANISLKASSRPAAVFYPAPDTSVHVMQPHETGYGSVCGVNQPAMLPPSCESSTDGGTVPAAPRGMFNTLRSSISGMASGVVSAIGLNRGASGDVYKVPEHLQPVPAGVFRGASLDLQWAPTLRRREPTLPGSRKSLDGPVLPQPRAAALARAPAVGPVSARLGASASPQPAQQQQQQQQGAAGFWLAEEQQGPSAMWGTPDMQAARGGSVYNNPLAQSQSGDGGGYSAGAAPGGDDGCFLSGGDTFLMPTDLTLADTLRAQSRETPAAVSRPWRQQSSQPPEGSSRPRAAPRGPHNSNWQ